MPHRRELGRGEDALALRRERIAVSADHAPAIDAEQAVTHGGAPLDQAVLGHLGAQR